MPCNKLNNNFWIPSGIFSSHYLLERLPQAGTKIWPTDEEVLSLYKAIQELYEKNIVGLRKGNEANTERRFIDKIFNKLGFGYLNQDKIPEAERRQVPDYFLYSTPEEADKAFELSPHKKYKLAISIAESKRWDHNLDQPSSGKGKAPRGTYPHQQIRDYLSESEQIRWGILTNGKEWRLYFKEGRSSKFFEIDLESCLEDLQKFKYFYILFSPDAFIKDSSDRCILDSIYDESLRFQEDVEKDLREKVFKCVERLGHGFLSRDENHLSKKDLDLIYHHSLILLYRILFVLNAEARDLLPTNPLTKYYKHYGIQRIIDRVRQEKGEFLSSKTVLYDDILALFHLINGSNEKLNKDMNIPRYNGGLFDPERYKFLEERKAGDDILSEVIYELSYRTDKKGDIHSIDYKGLGERHLGTVYEGLLEHKFSLDNGKVTLKNDKGERKATGSYYTPDYIVKYIVENTLGPILKKIDEGLHPTLKKGGMGGFPEDDSFAQEVLKLNICDPAMGSGHFLVEAVQYLADEIAYHPTTQLKTPKAETEDEINYWKRKVVESCIYGVDIKELAVELAKLSLWLKTVDKSQPLNFLDHHLRCGNSLIGARINDLNYLPLSRTKKKKSEEHTDQLVFFDVSQFKQDITAVIKGFYTIEDMPSEKLSDIKTKEMTFKKLTEELDRYREIADLNLSFYFGNNLEQKEKDFEKIVSKLMVQRGLFGADKEISLKQNDKNINITDNIYRTVVTALQSRESKTLLPSLMPLLGKSEAIAKEKNFFHWELEFPEVFFNADGSPKENPGFDCVIGNPPYVGFHGFEDIKSYLNQIFQSCSGKYDIYIPFIELSTRVLRKKGIMSYICPSGFMKRAHGTQLRRLLSLQAQINFLHDFRDYQVFNGVTNYTCIFSILNNPAVGNYDFRFSFGSNLYTKAVLLNTKDTLFDESWNITGDNFLVNISLKNTLQLKDIASIIAEGIVTGQNEVFLIKKIDSTKLYDDSIFDEDKVLKKALKGSTVNRYEIVWDETYFIYPYKLSNNKTVPLSENELKEHTATYNYLIKMKDKLKGRSYFDRSSKQWYELWNQRNMLHQLSQKIVVQENSMRNEFVIDKGNYFYLDTCCGISIKKEAGLSDFYVLAVLNSKLLDFIFKQITVPKAGGHYIHKPMFLERLPVARISFTTPEKERKEFFKEAVTLYKRSKYEDIIKWADYELALGRTDTSHDFLAYLAEQMIELNKTKNEEVKGFLTWFEREIGAEINTLANKTAIKEYHDNDFNHLLDVLKNNRNKISIDPSDRKKQELLENHFTKSISVLEPVKGKIKATDELIDEIVYKLYGLTPKEIEIVEGTR